MCLMPSKGAFRCNSFESVICQLLTHLFLRLNWSIAKVHALSPQKLQDRI